MQDRVLVVYGALTDFNAYSNAERSHRHVAAKIKKEENERIHGEVLYQKFAAIEEYPIRIDFHWYCKDKKIDPDNIAFAKKFLLDGMQYAQVLKNDGWSQIHGFSDTFHIDKDNPRVELRISVVN